MVKAVAGGGGRGMRIVRRPEELDEAWTRCRSEAQAAFGSGDLYLEALLPRARHVEVQVVGDGSGAVSQLGERDCSLQRRHQKLVEVAPAPGLTGELRTRLAGAAVRMASEVRYAGVGTFEFLLDADDPRRLAFIEANPRLQVEHTVTEEVTGIDLVATQLALAAGRSLADLGLRQEEIAAPRGFAVQVRVDGVATNLPFLQNLLRHPALASYRVTTRFVDEHLAELLAAGDTTPRRPPVEAVGLAGAKVDPHDPLAVLVHGKTAGAAPPATAVAGEPAVAEGAVVVRAPMQGTVVAVDVSPGDAVPAGGQLLVMEAMKMEHVVTAPVGGIVGALHVSAGDTVYEGHALLVLEESAVEPAAAEQAGQSDLAHVRPDLAEVHRRHAGRGEPPEEGPSVRAGRRLAPPGRLLHRGRRRPARGHRRGGRRRARLLGLQLLGAPQRAGAAGRRQLRPLLRGQRRAPRLLRRHHRDRELVHRHGRPRDDRGRRARRLPPRRGRPDARPGAGRRGRRAGGRRGGGGAGGEAVPRLLPGPGRRVGVRRSAAAARHRPGEPPPGLRL